MIKALRLVSLFSALCVLLSQPALAAGEKINAKSEKYAALMLDVDTGEVFYERNADAKRYPASLTKMMTLYMAFDALKQKRITLDTPLAVSAFAAGQPQTNISLKAGQTIMVQEAIKALVVRSANDVSVVVAEALGKSQANFAQQMTAKARSLGMKNTQFRNPHGLPDVQQYTTARDLAKLSIALRRDFPQYYHFFKTQAFTWKGRTFTSHNRVLNQYDGVDGIKTGYINMSGFNLATSVKRDGHHVVGVVMGGQTGRVRDAHMVSLLGQAFSKIAARGDNPRAFAEAPTPQPKPDTTAADSSSKTTAELPWAKVAFAADTADTAVASVTVEELAAPAAKPAAAKAPKPKTIDVAAEVSRKPFISFVSDANAASQAAPAKPLNKQAQDLSGASSAAAEKPAALSAAQKWGIQVGAFKDEEAAIKAASKAVSLARSELKYSQINITDAGQTAASVHRARLAGLSEQQAKRACQALSKSSTPCFIYKLDQRNL